MKVFAIILILFPAAFLNAQRLGELAPERVPEVFPPNSWGADIMFGEGGFGLGTFYRHSLSPTISGFVDFSISELKDEREVEYTDIFGNTYTPNKVNRAFLFPVNFGMQYRIFSESIIENFRPYISFGIGPTFILTDPYSTEFFAAFKAAQLHYAAAGYIGMGANFGLSKTSLIGINFHYLYAHIFGDGIEGLVGSFRKDFGQFYISLNLGLMY
jgi:hypothetical protein